MYVTEQEALPVAPAVKAQLEVAKLPVPLLAKVTVPVGLETTGVLSLTVTVQEVGAPIVVEIGRQVIVVVVVPAVKVSHPLAAGPLFASPL